MVEREFPSVHLVRNSDNRGFAAANNVAIRRATGRYILLLNPDTEVRPDTIPTLAGYLDAHPGIGICGPRILFPDGSFQCCGYRFPTRRSRRSGSRRTSTRLIKAVVGPGDLRGRRARNARGRLGRWRMPHDPPGGHRPDWPARRAVLPLRRGTGLVLQRQESGVGDRGRAGRRDDPSPGPEQLPRSAIARWSTSWTPGCATTARTAGWRRPCS